MQFSTTVDMRHAYCTVLC